MILSLQSLSFRTVVLGLAVAFAGCATAPSDKVVAPVVAPVPAPLPLAAAPKAKPIIGLALGGGGAKGFAHIGVIKALEAQGIFPDIVIGTSAGSVVGAMYASGKDGFAMQAMALDLEMGKLFEWSFFGPGFIKGDAIPKFVNTTVGGKTIENFPKKFGAVATDIESGEAVVFRRGDAGIAALASSSVPIIFSPVAIGGRQYVDGGLTNPVPVRLAYEMGATFVIAVDISDKPGKGDASSYRYLASQVLSIMGEVIRRQDRPADITIRPDISRLGSATFDRDQSTRAIFEGERAAAAEMSKLKDKLAKFGDRS